VAHLHFRKLLVHPRCHRSGILLFGWIVLVYSLFDRLLSSNSQPEFGRGCWSVAPSHSRSCSFIPSRPLWFAINSRIILSVNFFVGLAGSDGAGRLNYRCGHRVLSDETPRPRLQS
jgi:hypothetical protein